MGPFYCPTDQHIFLDTSFFHDMQVRFHGCSGKACEFTAAYMIAHEVGHHIQNLLGTLPKARRPSAPPAAELEANRIQVRVELQADCLAGVWAHHSDQRRNSIEPGDIEAALQTASAIGDDTLQQQIARLRGAGFLHPRPRRNASDGSLPATAGHAEGLQYIRGGFTVRTFRMPGIDQSRQFVPLKIAVLTVSDTRELADDKSGNTLAERVRAAGHTLAERAIVKDDVEAIRRRVKDWIEDKFIDVVITTGGTGFTGRDVTPEAVEPLFEKKMDGFATHVPAGKREEDRHLGDPDPRHRRRRQRDLYFLPARFAGRLQGCLGRDPCAPTRLPLSAVQFRRDIAAA